MIVRDIKVERRGPNRSSDRHGAFGAHVWFKFVSLEHTYGITECQANSNAP
jgi:hypothetical protein